MAGRCWTDWASGESAGPLFECALLAQRVKA